ncbi:MAG: phosphotransferase [Anaerolineae bacterium]
MSSQTNPAQPAWDEILAHFQVGTVRSMRPGGGTAAPKVLVETDRGRFLVRARRPQSSEDAVVAFDHSVIGALAQAGLPTVAPLPAYPTPNPTYSTGPTWVGDGQVAYEAFPFVEGLESFTPGDREQIASAAHHLARLHQVTADLRPEGSKPWVREHEIGAMYDTLRGTLEDWHGEGSEVDDARTMLSVAGELRETLTASLVASLPQVIIHADYTPANVMFRGPEVGGIFDFDWVSRQPRVLDVGEAMQFFAFRRPSPVNPDSIWSLVQAWEPDLDGARTFLRAYQQVWPLSPEEAAALPLFMRETWLGVRIRAMRKVQPEERLRILTEGALRPLRWLEGATAELPRLVEETRP